MDKLLYCQFPKGLLDFNMYHCHRSGYNNTCFLRWSLWKVSAQLLIQLSYSTGCYSGFFSYTCLHVFSRFTFTDNVTLDPQKITSLVPEFCQMQDNLWNSWPWHLSCSFLACLQQIFFTEGTEALNKFSSPIAGISCAWFYTSLTICYIKKKI